MKTVHVGLVVGTAFMIAVLAACSSSATSGDPSTPPSTSPAQAASPVFDVHEWGLLDVTSPTTAASLLAGPVHGPTHWDAPRRKPVLYFHLDSAHESVDVDVTVRLGAGSFMEHFPPGEPTADGLSLVWRGVHVRRASCHVQGAPTRDSPACQTVDEQCEAAELATYETADASCAAYAGSDYNHLFYRASGPPPVLPFDVVERGDQLEITHARATDVVVSVLYVHNEYGNVTVSIVPTPALGASVMVAPPTNADVTAALEALRTMMRETGLTPNEVDAFDRAWDSDLFGRAGAREVSARRGVTAGPTDYLLFALPASLIDGAASVTITPAPRALRRFMLVRLTV